MWVCVGVRTELAKPLCRSGLCCQVPSFLAHFGSHEALSPTSASSIL